MDKLKDRAVCETFQMKNGGMNRWTISAYAVANLCHKAIKFVKIVKGKMTMTKYTDSQLIYSATSRCRCGAGKAHPRETNPLGNWECSDLLTGRAELDPDRLDQHTGAMPYTFYEVLSEDNPSAMGKNTRYKMITLNGEDRITNAEVLTYDQVVHLIIGGVNNNPPYGKYPLHTITYSNGINGIKGLLVPSGGNVIVRTGMIFNATVTGNS